MDNSKSDITKEHIAAYRQLPTSVLSDALEAAGVSSYHEALKPLQPGTRVVGPAVTVRYLPAGLSGGTVGDYMDVPAAGDVLVLDNGGRTDCTVWGGILSEVAHAAGIAGTVIHGVCRDDAVSAGLGYPLFTRGSYMVTGKGRAVMEGVNVPVSLGRVRVEPGDLVVGDDMGVVVVPRDKTEAVLEIAQSIHAAEEAIAGDVRRGVPLHEARARHGYHGLQRSRAQPQGSKA